VEGVILVSLVWKDLLEKLVNVVHRVLLVLQVHLVKLAILVTKELLVLQEKLELLV